MIRANSRRLCAALCGFVVASAAGCAEMDFLPSWFPLQGPASDTMPGVVTPAERKAELRKLADPTGAPISAEEKRRISQQLVASMQTEKDPLLRVEIIRALGRYPGTEADAILKAALADPETNVRVAACEAWGKHHDAQAVTLLSETMRSDVSADVRLTAARALGETANSAAEKALGEGLFSDDPAMQYRCVLSLQKVTGKDYGDDVGRWQQYVKGETPSPPTLAERMWRWF